MPSDPGCPIQIEVNADRRLVERKRGVIEVRFTNLSPKETFSFEIALDGALLPATWPCYERLGPAAQIAKLVEVGEVSAANACVIRVRAIVQEPNGGRHVFAGHFDQEVHPASDGPSVVNYHVNVSAEDGAVVDAEGWQIGDRAAPKRPATGWRTIPMRADSAGDTLARCVLVDALRQDRLVIDARRAIVIGRDGGNADLALIDPERKISRAHCRLCVDAGGARVEHLSRTNTTRLNGVEVAQQSQISTREPSELLLAGIARLRLTPIASAAMNDKSARALIAGSSTINNIARPDGTSIGGYMIEAIEPPGTTARTLWLFGAVRARDVMPRISDTGLILASVPHLVRGQISTGGEVIATRPLRVEEQLSGWLVVG